MAQTKEEPMSEKKKTRGRRTKCTPEVTQKFMQAIRLGAPIKDACGCAGIGEATYYSWQEKAERGGEENQGYVDFLEEHKRVEGEATAAWLAVIEKAAREGSWQAAAWKLERRRGMVAKQKHTIDATVDSNVTMEKKKKKLRSIMKNPETVAAASAVVRALEDTDAIH